ncbi:conserved hypothetical protein [Desulforapulum autotrophicum HRM2]|uniref:DUF4062 domain-containing protein n=2 Tax=Desulforapulum autotrophicum TaxID=2296 RepID=C0QEZ9_DESAH|nr:conserved hypothetical protein [Desulforapulum autotrophicum HRM2]
MENESIMSKIFKIFVSSTYIDLVKEREQVIKACLEMGHIPVGMEMFSAAEEEQWKIIQRQIDESDYYVILVAHRYGSTTEEGISYTEKEYDYAASKRIPILGFVIDYSAAWQPNWIDQDEKKKRSLISFKEKIKNRLVDFWSDKNELHAKFSIALMKAIANNPRPGWVRDTIQLNLLEYEGQRDFSKIRDFAEQSLNEIGNDTLHIYMTNFDFKKQGSLRDKWHKFFIDKGNRVFQHLIYCIRSADDCDFILGQIETIKEFRAKEGVNINYELRVIFDHAQTDLSPLSLLILDDQKAFLSHDTKNNKKMSLQCYRKKDVEFIKRLWESFLHKDNTLLYSKELGIREDSIKLLLARKSAYLIKDNFKEDEVHRISLLIKDHNIFISEPIGCYLIGSLTNINSVQANDIDLVFLFDGKTCHPEEMIKMTHLPGLVKALNINLNLNGIPYSNNNIGYPTIDILCDWTEYIKKQDAVSVIDIALGNYKMLWGNNDDYLELKNTELNNQLIKQRLATSYNYIKRNCSSKKETLIKIAGKQFLQSFSTIQSSCFNPSLYLKNIEKNSQVLYLKPVLAYYSPESFLGSDIIEEILECYNILRAIEIERCNVQWI